MAGLDATGLSILTIDEILSQIEASEKALISPSLDVSATSVLGQINGIFAERERILWVLLRDIYTARTPGGASGQALIEISLLTGTKKRDATFSEVVATVNLNAGVTLPAGSQASVAGNATAIFETTADVTNSGGSPANVAAPMRAVTAGPVQAPSGSLTVIVAAVTGWNTVTNALDAQVGLPDETDPLLRARRELELRVQGSSNIDAIVADVETVAGVLKAVGFENVTGTDTAALEAHSFGIVAWDGLGMDADDDAVAQAIWNSKPAGIFSSRRGSGSSGVTATAIDAKGDSHSVNWARAVPDTIYLEVDLTVNSAYPGDGDTQVANAIKAYTDQHWTIGTIVAPSALYAAIFSIVGIVSINAIRVDLTASPTNTANLATDPRHIPLADTGRILVNS